MNHYEILGISETASLDEVRAAYLTLIRMHHPDRNASPDAAERSSRLNEAYSTLNDPNRRAHYDATLRANEKQQTDRDSTASPPAPPPDVRCQMCRARDSSLRLTTLHCVLSFLVVTNRSWKSGIRCSRCRALDSLKWSCLSLVAGWWGFPWGPIYTIHALFANAAGGTLVKSENASLLRLVAFLLFQDKNYSEAEKALNASLSFERSEEAEQFRNHVVTHIADRSGKRRDFWKFVSPIPICALVALIAYALITSSNAPHGYAARYQPPAAVNPEPALPEKPSAAAKAAPHDRVNDLVERLADVVATRAPVVGSHTEGTMTIRDHVLDRSKFEASELYDISEGIRKQLEVQDDSNGFVASSYFNARIFALSVDTINRIDRGEPLDEQLTELRALVKSPHVRAWLDRSRFKSPYDDLILRMASFVRRYRTGTPMVTLRAQHDDAKNAITRLESEVDQYKADGDIEAFNRLVPVYNSEVGHFNGLLTEIRFRSVGGNKLDLAFNRCLDAQILLGKFENVDLTSNAGEIEELP
jgi:hypothetical protein